MTLSGAYTTTWCGAIAISEHSNNKVINEHADNIQLSFV